MQDHIENMLEQFEAAESIRTLWGAFINAMMVTLQKSVWKTDMKLSFERIMCFVHESAPSLDSSAAAVSTIDNNPRVIPALSTSATGAAVLAGSTVDFPTIGAAYHSTTAAGFPESYSHQRWHDPLYPHRRLLVVVLVIVLVV